VSQFASIAIETSLAKFDRTSLPNYWRWVRLKDVCNEIYRYPSFYGMEHLSQGVAVIRGEHIDSSGEISTNWSKYWFVNTDVSNKFPRTMLREGDLVFTVRGTIGKVGIVRASHIGAQISPNLIRISPSSEIQSSFLWYYLHTIKGTEEAVKDNAVTIATVRASDLIELNIPLPPLSEQKRITAILNEQMAAVERARAATEAQLKAAKDLPIAYLRAAFESPDAKKWEKKRLKDLCDRITDGTHQPPPFASSGVPFLFVRNIVSGRIDFNVSKYVSLETYEELTRRCKPIRDDVLYSAVGSYGVAVVVDTDDPFTFQRHIAHLKPKRDLINSRFLALYLNSSEGKAQSEAVALGGAQRTVTLSSLAKFEVPLPSLTEQQQIAKKVSQQIQAGDQTKAILQDQLDTNNKLPAALLRQAFTGKL
jgi:type I restriction enzyme S subunit